jgi:pimeloyl-ACP methyl ester carboxylesterase
MGNIIFIHGLESSGEGFKGQFFRDRIPDILTPTFEPFDPSISISNLFKKRMEQLEDILNQKDKWIIIGSSFGGLMASLFALKYSRKIIKLILLAPYLVYKGIDPNSFSQITKPVIIFHGKDDDVIPIKPNKRIAEKWFQNLQYNIVNDDHMLHKTVKSINWKKLINQ